MSVRLGIDTGGTYTDAVIIDDEQNILASHKRLTTPFDLSIGISNVISALPAEFINEIDLVSLSTTLSTNSVVEGRGSPIAVILPGYNQKQVQKSGLPNIVSSDRIVLAAGGHDAMGVEVDTLDLPLIKQKVIKQADQVSAFAVSSMFGTRNTSHEIIIRDLIRDVTDKPVACGHELASALGAPRRALTAALNARMIPFITTLIDAVQHVLQQFSIKAPLMIVKGDGSLINTNTAQLQPVATVLSGPAASVTGGCALSGVKDGIVVDIGGTTTDIAVVNNGTAELCEDGARIGDWQPMVQAIRAYSIGLGGDSEIRFDGKLSISHRRVVPISLLAEQHPSVMASLERQMHALTNPRHNRFALPLQKNEILIAQLTRDELRAWNLLLESPLDIDALAESDRPLTRAIARLERMGLAIYSGFTPSDAMHVLDRANHWNKDAAMLGAQLWARQMRYLYGCGDWSLDDPVAPSEAVFELVIAQISRKIIEAGLNQHGLLNEAQSLKISSLLGDMVLSNSSNAGTPLFDMRFATNYPLIGVGGPAAQFLPQVAEKLRMKLILPDYANTANALGAIVSNVIQSATVTVTQPRHGTFLVFSKEDPMSFKNLDEAVSMAHELALANATELALSSGAQKVETRIEESREHVKHDIDGELFVSAIITAFASGPPERAH